MILIIDNYDSFTYNLVHLVAVEEPDVVVKRNDELSVQDVIDLNPNKILISPGPGRPEDAGITEDVIRFLGDRIPILGICLGHQAIGEVFGASVVHAPSLMHGKISNIVHNNSGLYAGIPQEFVATRYHSLVLDPSTIPFDLEITCQTHDEVVMGIRHKTLPIEGIQFHPESILTEQGPTLIKRWVQAK